MSHSFRTATGFVLNFHWYIFRWALNSPRDDLFATNWRNKMALLCLNIRTHHIEGLLFDSMKNKETTRNYEDL